MYSNVLILHTIFFFLFFFGNCAETLEEQEQQQFMEQDHACQNEENKNNPNGIIILGVYLHCEGCGNEVLRSLRGYEGLFTEITPQFRILQHVFCLSLNEIRFLIRC